MYQLCTSQLTYIYADQVRDQNRNDHAAHQAALYLQSVHIGELFLLHYVLQILTSQLHLIFLGKELLPLIRLTISVYV